MSFPASPIALTVSTNVVLPLPGLSSIGQIDWIVFSNNSPYVLEISCGGVLFHIPAWYYYPFPLVTIGSSGQKVRIFTTGNSVQVATVQQTIPGSAFTAQLFYTLYMNGETPPQTVPSALGGGPIDLTVATSIINTGQPGGNSVVFAEPVGDSSVIGTVNLNNLGQMSLGDLSNRGSLLIEGLASDYNISISLTGGIRITNSSANLVVDIENGFIKLANSSGTTKITLDALNSVVDIQSGAANSLHIGQTAQGDTIDTSGGATYVKSGSSVSFQVPNGTNIASITSAGINLLAGVLSLLVGSISRVQIISGQAVAVAGTSIAHSLGVTPTMVVGILNEGAAGTGVIGWNRGTATSTHFTAYVTPASTCDFFVLA